jgi:xylulokinase
LVCLKGTQRYEQLIAEAEEVPLGSHGVIFLPYLKGRGTPELEPSLRGAFLNLTLARSRGEMVRALIEGTSYSLAEVYDELFRLGFSASTIYASGGGSRSPLWRQILCDVLSMPLFYAGKGAPLGSAIIAAVGTGYYASIDDAVCAMAKVHDKHNPNPESAIAYHSYYERFKRTRDVWVKASHTLEVMSA